MTLKQNIREILKANGITIADLARRIGRSPQTLYNWFAGRSDVRGDIFEEMAAELKLKFEGKDGALRATNRHTRRRIHKRRKSGPTRTTHQPEPDSNAIGRDEVQPTDPVPEGL
jgi:transcriptional regulator with XRE-family HTH domain